MSSVTDESATLARKSSGRTSEHTPTVFVYVEQDERLSQTSKDLKNLRLFYKKSIKSQPPNPKGKVPLLHEKYLQLTIELLLLKSTQPFYSNTSLSDEVLIVDFHRRKYKSVVFIA